MLGLRYPIFQAPTGSIAGPELAAAVSEAGGLGAMGLTWTSPEEARRHVLEVRSRTSNPFQVNFALAFEPLALDATLEAGVPIVTFSWGDPSSYVARVRAAGALLGIQVTNAEEAQKMAGLSPDFLICQGVEAGGHVQALRPLGETLKAVVKAANGIPVVAAGGIADGPGIARVLAQGASGAMLGTRFVATQESLAHDLYKQKLVEESDTKLTLCFDGGWPHAPHRVLRNSTLREWEKAGSPRQARPGEADTLGQAQSGEPILRYEDTAPRQGMTGNIEAMCLYAGEGCALIRDLPRAGDLVEHLWQEANRRRA